MLHRTTHKRFMSERHKNKLGGNSSSYCCTAAGYVETQTTNRTSLNIRIIIPYQRNERFTRKSKPSWPLRLP